MPIQGTSFSHEHRIFEPYRAGSVTNDPPTPPSRARVRRGFFHPKYVRQERRQAYVLACVFFWSLLAYLFMQQFVLGMVEVVGESMVPNLVHGERHVVHRWLLHLQAPSRHDMVVLHDPSDGGEVIKRIVGLPGEKVEFREGQVMIDGQPLHEPFLGRGVRTYPSPQGQSSYTLGERQYFVLGDNRVWSLDSRFYGPVERDGLDGYVMPWMMP